MQNANKNVRKEDIVLADVCMGSRRLESNLKLCIFLSGKCIILQECHQRSPWPDPQSPTVAITILN